MTHLPLTHSLPREVNREIVESKRMLENRLGRSVTTFAYPYGLISRESYEIVRAHYRGACSAEMGTASRTDDHHRLHRVDMYYFREPAVFRLFGTLPGRIYIGLRAMGRTIRAGLTRCRLLSAPAAHMHENGD